MAILDVVATFAIPKVMSNSQDSIMKSRFKEAYTTVNSLMYKANFESKLFGIDWVNYLKSNLNYTKWCDEGFNDGCLQENGGFANQPTAVLASGAAIKGIGQGGNMLYLVIDLNASGKDMYDDNVLDFRVCIQQPCDWHNTYGGSRNYTFVPHDLDYTRFVELLK